MGLIIMGSSPLPLQIFTGFFVTLFSIFFLAKIAPKLKLVDSPSPRKRHEGNVPLVGGLAIYIALITGGLIWGDSHQTLITANNINALWIFISAGGLLVLVGTLDDRFKLSVTIRVLSETAAALIVIEGLDLDLRNLGALLGGGSIQLPSFIAYPFTLIAIFGIINAFNMLDGLDGLLGSLVLFTLICFHIFTETYPGFLTSFIAASILAFLISNLSVSRIIPKTFLGDAGSRLLGFIVVCLLLAAASSQVGREKLIQPVTALYITALPLFDMSCTVLRRIHLKRSPFLADRSHIHHLMQALGFSNRRALVIIIFLSSIFSSFGLLLNRFDTSEALQFLLFLSCFAGYCLMMNQAWRSVQRLDKLMEK